MVATNGHLTNGADRADIPEIKSLAEASEQLKIAKAKAKIQHYAVLEAYYQSLTDGWGTYVDPADRYRDSSRWLIPIGDPSARSDGKFLPFFKSEQELDEMRGSARFISETFAVAQGVKNAIVGFVVGDGYPFLATTKDDAPDGLIAAVQDIIDEFVDRVDLEERLQEWVWRASRDGEYFLRYFADYEAGTVWVREIEPEYVRNPAGGTFDNGWSFGIQHKQFRDSNGQIIDDVQWPLAYNVQYDPGSPGVAVEAEKIQHVKNNVDRNIKRGISDFYCTFESMEGVRRLLRNMREGAAVQAAIAGIWEYESASSSTVTSHLAATRDKTQNSPYGRTVNQQKVEPGTFLHAPKGKRLAQIPTMTGNMPQHVAVGQAIMRASIGARWSMPEYMISGDASNANYSSTLVAGSPFVRYARQKQKFFKRRFLEVIWRVLDVAADARKFSRWGVFKAGDLRRIIEVQCEPPPPEIRDEAQIAQIDSIDIQNGVMSLQTRRQRRGLDDEQEKLNIEAEPPPALQQPSRDLGQLLQQGQGNAGTNVNQASNGLDLDKIFGGNQSQESMKTAVRRVVEEARAAEHERGQRLAESILETAKAIMVQEDGTCKQGERADLTGCTPASHVSLPSREEIRQKKSQLQDKIIKEHPELAQQLRDPDVATAIKRHGILTNAAELSLDLGDKEAIEDIQDFVDEVLAKKRLRQQAKDIKETIKRENPAVAKEMSRMGAFSRWMENAEEDGIEQANKVFSDNREWAQHVQTVRASIPKKVANNVDWDAARDVAIDSGADAAKTWLTNEITKARESVNLDAAENVADRFEEPNISKPTKKILATEDRVNKRLAASGNPFRVAFFPASQGFRAEWIVVAPDGSLPLVDRTERVVASVGDNHPKRKETLQWIAARRAQADDVRQRIFATTSATNEQADGDVKAIVEDGKRVPCPPETDNESRSAPPGN